jgi:hypothetical protein
VGIGVAAGVLPQPVTRAALAMMLAAPSRSWRRFILFSFEVHDAKSWWALGHLGLGTIKATKVNMGNEMNRSKQMPAG